MIYTPQSFYHSKKWETFRKVLMAERTNDDGFIICEKCGKPILRPYDCIAHHKDELTDENVNDFTVSLNPDNIELIHFKCHNIEHRRFGGFSQRVFLVYGSPCSGKSTFVNDNAYGDDLIIDVDRLWDAICNDGRYKKANGSMQRSHRLKSNVFGLRDCLFEQVKLRKGMWRDCYIIGGYPLRSDRDRICNELRAEPIYIEASLEDCLARADAERPAEWKEFICDWFDSFTE